MPLNRVEIQLKNFRHVDERSEAVVKQSVYATSLQKSGTFVFATRD
jgi:hypothetical protein